MSLTVALLAAGSGRRFGAPKLLMPAGPGEVLLSRAARLALTVGGRVLCVLPLGADVHRLALADFRREGLLLLENRDAEQGMGTSLALAAKTCLEQGLGDEGMVVLPADLPGIDRSFLLQLITAYAAASDCDAAASRDGEGRLLAPAVLGPRLMPHLASLGADEGARSLLRRPGSRVVAVPLPRDVEDVDDFCAYRRLALREGWDREEAPQVLWREDLDPDTKWALDEAGFRIGATLAVSRPGCGPGISGQRGQSLPSGIRRVLLAGQDPEDRLQLLRVAALLSLGDESC